MEQEEFEDRLRDSPHLRRTLADLFQSVEQALSIVAVAAARQCDAVKLETDLLGLQSEAAADAPDPARDHILNGVRERLRILKRI